MQFSQAPCKRQTESVLGNIFADLTERLRNIVRSHSDACICNRKLEPALHVETGTDGNSTVARRRFDSIDQEIEQDLPESLPIGDDLLIGPVNSDVQRHAR